MPAGACRRWLVDHIEDVRSFVSPRPLLLRLVIRAVLSKARQAEVELRAVKAAEPNTAYRLRVAAIATDPVLHPNRSDRRRLCGGDWRD
jgi:hypothetical protein